MTILYYTIGFYMVSLYTCGTAQNRDSQKLRIFINYGRNWSEFVKRACLTWRSLSYFPLGKNSAPPKEGAVFVRFEFFRLFSLYIIYRIELVIIYILRNLKTISLLMSFLNQQIPILQSKFVM